MSPKEAERVRRSATEEELREGADQILEAHLRMEKQAQSQEELPLEDRKEEKHKDKSKYPKVSTEVARRSSGSEPQTRAPGKPSSSDVDPSKVEGGSTSTELRTPVQQSEKEKKKIEDRMRKSEEVVARRGDEGGGKKEDPEAEVSMLPPRSILFTPEQVSQMNQLYEQAPWLYGTPQSVFTPFTTVQRPASLVQEEARSKEEDGSARSVNPQVEIWRSAIKEHQVQREEMMRSALKEQSEKSEMMRMMQEMIKSAYGFQLADQ